MNNQTHSKKNGPARVLIVDDHPVAREGIKELLQSTPGLLCCGEAENVATAREALLAQTPDLVLLDLKLGAVDCFDFIEEIGSRWPSTTVLVLSMHDERLYAERVLRAGGNGYVMKENVTSELLAAIQTVLAGGIHVSAQVQALAVRKMAGKSDLATNLMDSQVERLTAREFQVFGMLGRGLSTPQIAKHLSLSVRTIDSHRENIKRKMNLANAAALAHAAVCWMQQSSLMGE